MEINVTINNEKTFVASMENNQAAKDFISILPMTLNVSDYASTEKVSDLPKKLSISDAPKGHQASVGDITYYSPWGNLAIFYKNFSYASGLVLLGHMNISAKDLSNASVIKFEQKQ